MTVIWTIAAMLATYGAATMAAEALTATRHHQGRTTILATWATAALLAAAAWAATIPIHP